MNGEERCLRSLAVIRCSGPDAVPFLQGQLTSDVGRLEGRTQLAAYATAQGRVIAILRLFGRDDALYALLPAALASPVVGRLRKFVLRAKARIDALEDWSVTWVGPRPGRTRDSGQSNLGSARRPWRHRLALRKQWRLRTGVGIFVVLRCPSVCRATMPRSPGR